eukprot:GFUD01004901.1.p1 GENE.GFUD01004901.1~~GFUD01004901.1.p1  ORF type:complete len:915 (-),score=199.65 GFUD01004901.1:565-3309(-)
MNSPAEFSLESVRQLMLASGGRVTNHELVKSFRRWLTDPQGKETARAQFKDYVNTLATIKQENGEKFLILKKKFYPEYYNCGYVEAITPTGYSAPSQYDSYSTGYSTDNNYNSTSYTTSDNYSSSYSANRKQPSSFYEPPPINNYHQNAYEAPPSNYKQPVYDPPKNNYSAPPVSSYTPSLTNGNGGSRGSPSLLDEVMAGFSPPSRTMGRQLPAIPTNQPTPQQSINSLGLPPAGPNSLGLPSRQEPPVPSHYQRQSSVDSLRGSTTDLHYSSGGYNPHSVHTQEAYTPHPDTTGYNQGFNPHITHNQRNSVASAASYSSGTSYHGSPRGSYAPPPPAYAGSPRSSYASPPNSYTSPPNNFAAGSPRASIAPPFSNSPRNSYAALPLSSSQSSSSSISARPPPPYRAPPPDPIQHRPLPDRPKETHRTRPAELNLPTRPADSVLPPVPMKAAQNDSPPPPPKRTVPSESNHVPPPLPRRPPPTTSLQPIDTGHTHRSRSQSTNLPSKISESQPSPTDSGFTEDSSKFSESLMPKNISLSKSFGNLTVEDDEEKFSKMESSISLDNLDTLPSTENEKSISVRERTKTFNRMASETEIPTMSSASSLTKLPSAVKRRNSRAIDFGSRRGSNLRDNDDTTDSSSITTIDPTIKQWMVHTAKGDYQTAAKMLMDDPKLARHRDFTSGYTGLHWACKHGNLDLVKLLAGTYQSNVNAKSHGGYTPLHIAAQHNHQDVFDLLVQAYRADANTRDYAGKKPRQYMIVGDTGGMGLSMSSDTFRQLKDRRKNRTSRMEKNPGILRFGSLSVKVKKTTEAFNNYFNSKDGSESKTKWGNTEPDTDVEKMPPPKFAPIKKRKSKRTIDFGRTKSAPVTPTERSPIKEVIHEAAEENISDIDSDSEYGFGDKWGPGEKPGVSHA